MRPVLAALLLGTILSACSSAVTEPDATRPTPSTPPYPVGKMTDQTLVVGGVTRQYRVHVPAGLTTPKAVVFVPVSYTHLTLPTILRV